MCEIKFRVRSTSTLPQPIIGHEWIAGNGRWYHQYIGQPTSEGQCHGIFQREQFTGRLDNNGNEIYKSDIVSSKAYHDKLWEVVWTTDSEYCGFVLREIGKESLSFFVSWHDIEVIGNRFENPDLLPK